MKICFLTSNLNIKSGWGRYSYEIISRISQFPEIEAEVLVESASGYDKEKVILPRNVDNIFVLAKTVFEVRKVIKKSDIVHCFDGWPYGVIATLANIGLNKTIIINGVGTFSVAPLYQLFKGKLLAWSYKKAKKILCISQFTLKEIASKVKLNNLLVVNLGVDFNKFANFKPSLGKDKITILSVGALKTRKGYHISIPAVAKLVKNYPNLIYYIIGDQLDVEYFNQLKSIVRENNIEGKVIFLDNISDNDLISFYYQADLFLLTPINIEHNFEGYGLVYLEAGACGKPVIGTFDCGAEDAIQNGITGLLVPQNNIEETAKAILQILTDPKLASKLGENGQIRAKEMDWSDVVTKYIKVYEDLLK